MPEPTPHPLGVGSSADGGRAAPTAAQTLALAQLAPGQLIAGHRLLRRIGQGTHGAVFLAAAEDGQPLALKVVTLPAGDSGAATRSAFLRSAQTARQLVHPDIVQLHAAGVTEVMGWLAMEAVPGSDLARYTRPGRLLPEPLVLKLCARLAQAAAYAHRQGVVHRDIKPANVLVDWPSQTVKLADFGLARADDGVQTGTGIVLGSPAYMSPEQLAGAVPTPSSDLYALGATAYQLLTGRLPHEGASMGDMLRRVAEDPPPDPRQWRPELPAAAAHAVMALLAKRPQQRPQDGDDVAHGLNAAAALWTSRPRTSQGMDS